MLPLDAAFAILTDAARPLPAQSVPLAEAAGHWLAAPVIAAIDAPRADVSTMDGYAVRHAVTDDAGVRVIGEARPGHPHPGMLEEGEAVRLFTGAPIPRGTDRVIMQERAGRDGDLVRFTGHTADPAFIRRRGSDFVAGTAIIAAGTRLTAGALIAAAAADVAEVAVVRRPRVTLLATGDELVTPGAARADAHAIPDSLTIGLAAAIEQWGGAVTERALLPDHLPGLRQAATRARADADVIVVTGGASVGAHDHARTMFGDGLSLLLDKVAVKPGKPVWLATAGEGGPIILGLPGNPGSAYVTARLFLAPLLVGLGGGDPQAVLAWQDLPLAAPLPSVGDRDLMTRAQLLGGALHPLGNQDSGAQAALALATHLIWQRAGASAACQGQLVKALAL